MKLFSKPTTGSLHKGIGDLVDTNPLLASDFIILQRGALQIKIKLFLEPFGMHPFFFYPGYCV